MNADIQGKLDAIKAPFQSVIEATDAIPAMVDAAEKVAHDAGFAEGQASIVLPSPTLPDGSVNPDLLYTQAQMDALAVQVRTENDTEVADLKTQLASSPTRGDVDVLTQQNDALKVQIAGLQADLAAKDQSLAAFKQLELEKIKALEVDFSV